MHVTVPRKQLADAVALAARAIAANSSLPILKTILLEAQPERLRLSATNLETHIEVSTEATTARPGRVCLPGKALQELVSALPEGDVVLDGDEDGRDQVTVRVQRSDYRLHGMRSEDMPALAELVGELLEFRLTQRELRRALAGSVYAVSDDDTRVILTSILLQVRPQWLTCVGTDTHRMAFSNQAISILKPETGEPAGNVLLPGDSARELLRLLKDTDDAVRVRIGLNGVTFETAATLFYSRLLDGQFPKYERVIPSSHSRTATVNRQDLYSIIRRVRLVAREAAAKDRVLLQFQSNSLAGEPLTIAAEAADLGKATEQLDAELQGEFDDFALAVNAGYLIDVLDRLGTERVEFRMTECLSPFTVEPVGLAEGALARTFGLIMPMQVQ